MGRKATDSDKNVGDQFYSMAAPEECRFWILGRPWQPAVFRDKYKTALVSVNVKSSKIINMSDGDKYTLRDPLFLPKTGIEITDGYTTRTAQSQNTRFNVRVDSVIEFNSAMKELSAMYSISQWRVLSMEVYNINSGITCYFEIFNPNGTGDKLALYKVLVNGDKVLYSELDYPSIKLAVGLFQDDLISCTMHPAKLQKPVPICSVMNKNEIALLASKEKIIKQKRG